jgi:hypothetical protein
VYAKTSDRRAELVNGAMDVADRISSDQEMVMRAVVSAVERVQMCADNQSGQFQNARRM